MDWSTGELLARTIVAQERALTDIRQCVELDFLILDEEVKDRVFKASEAVGKGKGKANGKRVACFKEVLLALQQDKTPGTGRLIETTPGTLAESLVLVQAQKRRASPRVPLEIHARVVPGRHGKGS